MKRLSKAFLRKVIEEGGVNTTRGYSYGVFTTQNRTTGEEEYAIVRRRILSDGRMSMECDVLSLDKELNIIGYGEGVLVEYRREVI